MPFDHFLQYYDDDAGQKEQVGLVIYYLETEQGQDEVTQADVRDVIQRSRSSISSSSISTYFARLRGSDWITNTENDGCRLTHFGEKEVEARLDDEALDNPRGEEDFFLDINGLENGDGRYEQLIADINETYRYRLYDATMVLTRKFFEDMVFQILKTHYAGEDNEMFYDQENNRHYSFDDLLTNLREGVPTLRQYARELERSTVDDLLDLKQDGNSGAHAIRVDFTDEEIESWSDDATRIAEILYEVLRGARIADNRDD
jgi:Mn-dependent DtxR family transcriptional regulator